MKTWTCRIIINIIRSSMHQEYDVHKEDIKNEMKIT